MRQRLARVLGPEREVPVKPGGPGIVSPAAAFDPGRRGVRALAVVAIVVVAGAGLLAWRARPRSEPVAPSSTVATAASAGSVESSSATVVVAITGKVRRPGLVRLPAGARVADALDAAGGVLPGTDLSYLNLARKLADGELIVVGLPAPAGTAVPGAGAGAAGSGARVNLNTATVAQLDALPGVGPVMAQRIIDYRDRHGGFKSVSELRQVDGIGDARFDDLKDLVTV